MRLSSNAAAAAAAIGATVVSGATTPFCPTAQVCFRWAVLPRPAGATTGDVVFQLQAPTAYRWVAVGTGSQMRGSDMFVVYAADAGNVTLSTRRGTGHEPPADAPRGDVALVEGSGIGGGVMTANVRCSGCGGLDLDGSAQWIAAWQAGGAINSRSPSAPIGMHDGHRSFSVDMAKAAVASDEGPFFGPGGGPDSGRAVSPGGPRRGPKLGLAHGVLMTILFTVAYPVGSMLMPLVGNWLLHAVWQMVTFLGMWAGLGIGWYINRRAGFIFDGTHVKLGTAVCALMCVQPVLGWLHHMHYLKHQRRGPVSYGHIWYGRCLMILGIINGGLGVKLTGSQRPWVIGYCVLAAVFSALYVAVAAFKAVARMRSSPRQARKPLVDSL